MDKKTKSTLQIVSFIFLIVGIGLAVGCIIISILGSRFQTSADEVTATISRIESRRSSKNRSTSHTVYVDFTYNGQSYEDIKIGMYSSSMYEGKEIKILCDPENPTHIKAASEDLVVGLILGIMGVSFIAVFGLLTYSMIRNSKYREKLLSSGRQLYATIEKISIKTNYSSNGKNPYLIYCTYKDEYKDLIYRFKSDPIWTDPNLVLKPGDTIRVYVSPEDYSHYYVDTEDLFKGKVIDYT